MRLIRPGSKESSTSRRADVQVLPVLAPPAESSVEKRRGLLDPGGVV